MIIYKATNTENGKFYIGKTTKSLARRKYVHEWSATQDEQSRGYKSKFYNTIRKYGADSFSWEIIDDTASTTQELNEKECHYIASLDAIELGYNISSGGTGGDNFTNHPNKEEIRRKISEANTGRKMSEEFKKQNRERQIGRVISPETIEKRRRKMKGKAKSEDHKQKIRQSLLGRIVPEKVREKISETLSGRKQSAEHIRRRAEAAKGTEMSAETKRKISQKLKGRVITDEWREKIRQGNLGKKHKRKSA